MSTQGFCIFIDTLLEGSVPSVRNQNAVPFVFPTRLEAQREIADNAITRLQEFLDGDRDFDDAIGVEEYVVAVQVLPDGTILDGQGGPIV